MGRRKELVSAACDALRFSYAPYSVFRVGAAVLTSGVEQKIFSGCNVENGSLGATICAERVAVVKAVSEGFRDFSAIAVAVEEGGFVYPCGICLQFLSEFCDDMEIILVSCGGKKVKVTTLSRIFHSTADLRKRLKGGKA